MKPSEILKEGMKIRNYNQSALAKKSKTKRQSDVSRILKSENPKLMDFVELMGAMGFEVIVTGDGHDWTLGEDTPVKMDLDSLLSDSKPHNRIPLTSPTRS